MRSEKRDAVTIEDLKDKLQKQREYLDRLYNGPRKESPAVHQLIIAKNEAKEALLVELIRECGHFC